MSKEDEIVFWNFNRLTRPHSIPCNQTDHKHKDTQHPSESNQSKEPLSFKDEQRRLQIATKEKETEIEVIKSSDHNHNRDKQTNDSTQRGEVVTHHSNTYDQTFGPEHGNITLSLETINDICRDLMTNLNATLSETPEQTLEPEHNNTTLSPETIEYICKGLTTSLDATPSEIPEQFKANTSSSSAHVHRPTTTQPPRHKSEYRSFEICRIYKIQHMPARQHMLAHARISRRNRRIFPKQQI